MLITVLASNLLLPKTSSTSTSVISIFGILLINIVSDG
ncbi:MAG: LPXTG cell wall anchor domain-containing protein [Streptococcus sp.]|nr:MAG: LPXTG cell wall anchor domain-containing protein [Streptococcus sp.]